MKTPIDRFPPFLCRAFAHVRKRPMTREEIASKAGLTIRMVDRLSKLATWKGVKVGVAFRFSEACGVDLIHPRAAVRFLKHKRRSHWSYTPAYKEMFDRLLAAGTKAMKDGSS